MEKEEMADGKYAESLFCLELLVESVCINRDLLQPLLPGHTKGKRTPLALQLCVAFRLLDFPTLFVYPPKPQNAVEGPQAPLLNVIFGRGKSCIFRMGMQILHAHLSHVPLYTMLLLLGGQLPHLLASASLSLASISEHRGTHALCDLMGCEVGQLALAYRLLNLGSNLLPHLPPCSSLELLSGEKQVTIGVTAADKGSVLPTGNGFILKPLPLERPEEPQLLVVTETDAAPSPCKKASMSTQTQLLLGKSSKSLSETDLEIGANVFCPPPLFYCSGTLEPKKELPLQYRHITKEDPVLIEGTVLKEEFLIHPMKSTPARTEEDHRLRSQQPHPAPPDLRHNIKQFPLLNALLVELSLLSNQPVADSTGVHPQLAWLYRSVSNKEGSRESQIQSKLQTESDKLEFPEKDKKSSSPKHKIADVLKLDTSLSKNPQKEAKKITEPKKSSETKGHGHSTKKLLYGLTNTLKLRLQQKNPDMLIVHERREQYRKKQQEMLKLKKRRNRGNLPTEKLSKHSSTHIQSYRSGNGRISYPNRSFDEKIEPLMKSSMNKNGIKLLPQNHITEHGLNDHVKKAMSNNCLEDNANLCSLEKSQVDPEHFRENKRNGKMLLPQPVAQDFGIGDTIVSKNINTIHDHGNTGGEFASFRSVGFKENPNNSLSSSPEVIYSDDFIASQES
uniref:Microtubule-associated protein 10 n=1 Tax=Geotrypetes seraphini TaxID=260995 RepID=A0A6P8RCX9_GEOSA|nr:microtubule-associated protein 10 [Geotrypetes seraphini]